MRSDGVAVLVLCVASCALRVEDDVLPEDRTVAEVIQQFPKHNLIWHYEDATAERVDAVMRSADVRGSYFVTNYDAGEPTARPTGYRFLHVVLLDNCSRFEAYTGTSAFSLEHVDVLLFVVNLSGADEPANFTLWRGHTLDRAGALFVLDAWHLQVYTVCFFCGNRSKELRPVSKVGVARHVNTFSDFHGHHFRVGYTMYRPYFWCRIVKQTGDNILFDVFGAEGELLALLNEVLNLQYYMVEFKNESDLWGAMVDSVHNKTLDWAVGGITLSIQRSKLVDFTSSIRAEAFTVLYSISDDPWMSWQQIALPFHASVWLILLSAVFVMAGLLHVTVRGTRTQVTLSFWDFMQGCWRLLVEQPLKEIPVVLKARWTTTILSFLWLAVTLIMTNAYKSKLTSSVINSRSERLDTIDQLVERGFRFQLSDQDSSVLEENLRMSADPQFLEALQRSANDLEFCDAVLKTIGSKVGVIDEETSIQFMVQDSCRKMMSVEQHDELRLTKDDLFPEQHAWPLQLAAPYRARFDGVIARLHAAGIFAKWNTEYASPAQRVLKSNQRAPPRATRHMSLASLTGPAFIWVLGNVLALAVLVAELVHGR